MRPLTAAAPGSRAIYHHVSWLVAYGPLSLPDYPTPNTEWGALTISPTHYRPHPKMPPTCIHSGGAAYSSALSIFSPTRPRTFFATPQAHASCSFFFCFHYYFFLRSYHFLCFFLRSITCFFFFLRIIIRYLLIHISCILYLSLCICFRAIFFFVLYDFIYIFQDYL